jgi:putative endonuclease
MRKARATVSKSVAAPAWHVYIVRTRDGALYTGVTTDVARRLAEHRADGGRGARYLRGRGPLEVVYRRKLGDRALALSVEWRLKRRPRADKQAIVSARLSRRALLRRLAVGDSRKAAPKSPTRSAGDHDARDP